MKTKLIVILAAFAFCAVVQAAETNVYPSLVIGTNTYKNVTVRKRNSGEAMLKFEGGLLLVKADELPKEVKEALFTETEIAKFQGDKAALLANLEQNKAKRAHDQVEAARAQNFRIVDGQLVAKKSMVDYSGNVISKDGDLTTVDVFKRVPVYGKADSMTRIGGFVGNAANDIDLPGRQLTVEITKANHRDVSISENCAALLEVHALKKTPILSSNWKKDWKELRKRIGYGEGGKKWANDLLRHTGITHYLKLHKNEAIAATWAGNSVDVIRDSYKAVRVPEADTAAFWSIGLPVKAGAIVPLPLEQEKRKAG